MLTESIKNLFSKVRENTPLVHHLTNTVTINDCANVTLAIGGSPVMATSLQEVEHMVQLSSALVINFGTIDNGMYESMLIAGKAANAKGIPVIFDPVGVGATPFRTQRAKMYIEQVKVSIIRGNVSEVYALIGGKSQTKGVDAGEIAISKSEVAVKAAKQLQTVVVISGEQDVVSDGKRMVHIHNGDVWLTKITGTGCMTASLIACFASVSDDFFQAAVAGMSVMSLAGELAKEHLNEKDGIGTYRMKLMDEIFFMDGERWEKGVRLS